jgi:hypothetical protein
MNGGPWLVQNRPRGESNEFEPIDIPSAGLHLYVADCVSKSDLPPSLPDREVGDAVDVYP